MVTAKDSLIKSRVAAGLTMRGLSERSGVAIATISRAENGKPLSAESAHRLCKAFNLGFDDLFIIRGNTAANQDTGQSRPYQFTTEEAYGFEKRYEKSVLNPDNSPMPF